VLLNDAKTLRVANTTLSHAIGAVLIRQRTLT
jgi:hypothetical protein